MEYKTLIITGIKRNKGILIGIFTLVLLVSVFLGTVLNVWINADRYIHSELSRVGFGELTAWVSAVADISTLTAEMEAIESVERVEVENLAFANYTVGEQKSDSEGQLITYSEADSRYKFFTDDLSDYQGRSPKIKQGEVYVSPSLISMFDLKVGDNIQFAISRNGGTLTLTVRGYYEDPFMGSSMIGMKGFLIAEDEYKKIVQTIQEANIDALARNGAMLHIFKGNESLMTTAELNSQLNENTTITQYTEFVHSASAIAGFMLVLQKAFSSLLIAFVLILLLVVLVVLGHSITSTIEADFVNMGILKTTGITTKTLRQVKLIQYGMFILPAMLIGLALSKPLSAAINSTTLTTSGVRVPTDMPLIPCLLSVAAILVIFAIFILVKTAKIGNITPMKAIRGEAAGDLLKPQKFSGINGNYLGISIACRQLITGKKKYVSACIVAALLTFFLSTIGNIDSWLGADGKGMMDAFNPADHDIGVQVFGDGTEEDAQKVVLRFTDITDTYLLAMPGVAVDGIDYTVNAISEPDRFHILQGRTCTADNEIVVTEFVAADLGVSIGDTLTVTGDSGSEEYVISGIYSCANDMGNNIGMSREGYLKVGKDDPQIWCHHYFLADASQKTAITDALDVQFGGDVHTHENTWPGLFGIIFAMRVLVAFMYGIVFLFILIVTVMTGSKMLSAERRDIGIYKAIGFTFRQLKLSFALRFTIVAMTGSGAGVLLGAMLTDVLISTVMKLAGISNFASIPSVFSSVFPAVIVTLLFMSFAYFAAGKIKKTDLTVLITE